MIALVTGVLGAYTILPRNIGFRYAQITGPFLSL